MLYRGFPSKLHHEVPQWVETGALFHIRIAVDREKEQVPLTAGPSVVRFSSIIPKQTALAHHVIPADARSSACASFLCQRRVNEQRRWRLETFSNAQTRHYLAGRIFRSSTAR